jgi:DNA polymerase V
MLEDKDIVKIKGVVNNQPIILPFIDGTKVPAGFPSPAMDYIQDAIDLNKILIKHPASTFLVEVEGDSMLGAFISNPALLIIDRAIQAKDNDIVLAVVNGEYTVKRLQRRLDKITLLPANPKYKPIEIVDGMEFQIWGCVAQIIIDPKKVKYAGSGRL